jgi:hypothetical protein
MILVFAAVGAAVVAAAAAIVYFGRKAKGEAMEWSDFGKIIAMAQAALGNIFTEAEVDAVARFSYQRLNLSSDFYTEEQWVELFKSIFPAKTSRSARDAEIAATMPALADLGLYVQSLRSG